MKENSFVIADVASLFGPFLGPARGKGELPGRFQRLARRWWKTCSSCRQRTSSHRKDSKPDPAALDPGCLCGKFGSNDLMIPATPFPLAAPDPPLDLGHKVRPIFRTPCAWLNSKVLVQKGQPAIPSPASAALECSRRVLLPSIIRLTLMTVSSLVWSCRQRQSMAQPSLRRSVPKAGPRAAHADLCHLKSLSGPTFPHSSLRLLTDCLVLGV